VGVPFLLSSSLSGEVSSAAISTTNPIDAMTSSACDSHDGPTREMPVEMIPVAITNAK